VSSEVFYLEPQYVSTTAPWPVPRAATPLAGLLDAYLVTAQQASEPAL
jgi:hypothetical protein